MTFRFSGNFWWICTMELQIGESALYWNKNFSWKSFQNQIFQYFEDRALQASWFSGRSSNGCVIPSLRLSQLSQIQDAWSTRSPKYWKILFWKLFQLKFLLQSIPQLHWRVTSPPESFWDLPPLSLSRSPVKILLPGGKKMLFRLSDGRMKPIPPLTSPCRKFLVQYVLACVIRLHIQPATLRR